MSPQERAAEAARLREARDFAGSERELKLALEEAPDSAGLLTDLAASISRQGGREPEMERYLRAAVAVDPLFFYAADPLARYLLVTQRPQEALAVTTPLAVGGTDNGNVLRSHINALRALGRMDEGLPFLERLAGLFPDEAPLQRELTATLVDAGRLAEAQARLDDVLARGGMEGADWMVRGFLMKRLGWLDEAEAAYREAVRWQPDQMDAQRELSELIWARTGDAAAATRELTRAIDADPSRGILRQMKAKLLQNAGDDRAAYEVLAPVVGGAGGNPGLNASASQAAITFDPEMALSLAQKAMAGMPDNLIFISIAAEAALAAGKPKQALELAGRMRRMSPINQHGIALTATAWRILGDDRHKALNDYERLVRPERLDTPDGWDCLESYLKDLTATLHGLHGTGSHHPIGQSVRGGGQVDGLETSTDPVIKAFFQAVDGPLRRYMDALGKAGPAGERNTGKYGVSGAWSVKLRPGGRHVSHLHPWGWLSSACYLELPEAVGQGGREGWLAFGEPGIPTVPVLEAEHWVKPEPGMLVLFPSYLWHGTVPFGGDQTRLTTAFDVVPA